MTIAACLAEWDRMVREGYYYDNSIPGRCLPWPHKGRDCSTFAAAGINAGFPGALEPCSNSFGQADWCHDAERPDWFTERFGPGQGTFITYEQAQTVVCLGFRGNNYGRSPDNEGDGHVEVILGRGKLSVGAHSHATGIGYDDDGLDTHHLSHYAVPPCFLAEMAPPPWKVQPMYNPALQLRARLANPQGGWWEAYADGRVDYLRKNGTEVHGGMITPKDRAAFAGREVAKLHLRWYKPKGSLRKKAGYTIETTSGEKYVPEQQH